MEKFYGAATGAAPPHGDWQYRSVDNV